MEEKLREVDQLLSTMTVSGDNVIILANARIKLNEIYVAITNSDVDKVAKK